MTTLQPDRPARPERGAELCEGPPARRGWRRRAFGTPAALLAAALAAGCSQAPPAAGGAKRAEVVVTTPVADEVTDYQDFTGRLDAVKTVEIRARVSGYVQQVPFKEGDLVKEGDLLFQIDPRTYQADYNQAVANFKQAEADRKVQEKNAERVRRLIGNGAISQEEYDQTMAAWEKAVATAGAMEAARDRAKLYLDYARVTSPVSGRVSRRFVDPGNLVNADNTMLTTVVTEDPMYAYFDVDERTYLELVEAKTYEQASTFSGLRLPVQMRLANEEEFVHQGTVDFVDNRLNGNTGTIRMRGVFENPRRLLKSGLFVRVRLPVGAPYKALLIPDEAVLSDQGKKYVYVVNDKSAVEYRSVKLGQAIHELRVIREGVAPGERVIVTGMQRVRPKAEVQVKVQDPPKPPSAAQGKRPTAGRTPPAGAKDGAGKG